MSPKILPILSVDLPIISEEQKTGLHILEGNPCNTKRRDPRGDALTSDWYCTFKVGHLSTKMVHKCPPKDLLFTTQNKIKLKNGGLRPDLCSPISNASVTKVIIFFISSMYFYSDIFHYRIFLHFFLFFVFLKEQLVNFTIEYKYFLYIRSMKAHRYLDITDKMKTEAASRTHKMEIKMKQRTLKTQILKNNIIFLHLDICHLNTRGMGCSGKPMTLQPLWSHQRLGSCW